MKKLFRIIKRCRRDIEDINANISNIETLPYYSIFGTEEQREKDLQTCYDAKEMTMKEYYVHLENLQLEIEKEKHRISQEQRKMNLLKLP